jgi:HEAT repeat protein
VTAANLALMCGLACGCWLLLAAAIPIGRHRARRRLRGRETERIGEWTVPAGPDHGSRVEDLDEAEAGALLRYGLRSDEREIRVAAVTALSGLARDHEWALDGLVEALASELETPERVATELDRLAPRPGRRLVPLLGHPSEVVRFYVVRLLGRYPELARRHVPARTRDASPHVRAAALEALRASGSTETLRRALELLSDTHPFVRAQACRTATATAKLGAATFVAPMLGDESWWVREAAREALVGVGPGVAPTVSGLIDHADRTVRKGAALVLQDVGALDALAGRAETEQLERILAAGGGRLRRAASERARRGLDLAKTVTTTLERAS